MPYGIGFPDIITWIIIVIGFVAHFSKISTKVNDHEKLLYDNETGQVNMVSFTAHDRITEGCKESRAMRCRGIDDKISALSEDIKAAERDTSKLNGCVILLNKEAGSPCGDML